MKEHDLFHITPVGRVRQRRRNRPDEELVRIGISEDAACSGGLLLIRQSNRNGDDHLSPQRQSNEATVRGSLFNAFQVLDKLLMCIRRRADNFDIESLAVFSAEMRALHPFAVWGGRNNFALRPPPHLTHRVDDEP